MIGPPDAAHNGWLSRRRRPLLATAATLMLLAAGCSGSDSEVVLLPDQTASSSTTIEFEELDLSVLDEDGEPGADAIDRSAPSLIRVDQFGYRPADPKVAVLVDPQVGYDAEIDFTPGPVIQVRRVADDEVVFEGSAEPWAGGDVHEQSGDRGWWFDFSELDVPGSYYIVDPENQAQTGPFDIADEVYNRVLEASLRMFWYNRGNTPHAQELAGPWSDEAAYIGPGQDTEARSVDDQDNAATALDLSGGWFDAGDTNKYVTFASEPVHLLLTAYRLYPEVFDDSLGIPESGNGIPDVIDEVRWETDWLKKMQLDDGGLLTKVGLISNSEEFPPSASTASRFYEEVCSSSTITAAAMFAHAAVVFSEFPELADEATDLEARAERAWDWYQDNAKRDDCDAQIVRAGDADMSLDEQRDAAVVAAIYLFALTGDDSYDAAINADYADMLPLAGDGFGNYGPDQSDALLFYRELPSADQTTVADINARIDARVAASPLYGFEPDADLYRAFMPDESYHWGSNMVKANIGGANLAIDSVSNGRTRALGHLHYFHGVNPLNLVYLSNMDELGAERSTEVLFHYWFGEMTPFDVGQGSTVGVAPGFLVGGPNRDYSGPTAPPAGQPPMKSYRDWAAYGSEPTWEISEPAIYYQAAYVRLLAAVQASR